MDFASIWQARSDRGEPGDTRRLAQVVAPATPQAAPGLPVLLGFACDAGVARNQGRPGAAAGPLAIRRAMAALPAHALHQLQDAGDVPCTDDDLEAAQARYAQALAGQLARGAQVLALGGGHEIAWGSFLGLRQWLDGQGDASALLVLNLDAHFDLRSSRPAHSGTPFDQIARACAARGLPLQYACLGVSRASNTPALYARAQEIGAFWVEDLDMGEGTLAARLADIDRLLERAAHVYLTIDLDVLPASVMPGVSAPAAYGVPLAVVERIAAHVAASGKLRLAELAECNPAVDAHGHSARVAARLGWRILQEWQGR